MPPRILRLALFALAVGATAGTLAAAAPAADFRTVANGACVRYDRTTSAFPEVTSAAEMKRQAVLGPKLFRTMVDTIAAAPPPPPAQRKRAANLVASLRQVQRALNAFRDAFLRGDKAGMNEALRSGPAPSAAAAAAAKVLGLPVCARLAADAAKGPS